MMEKTPPKISLCIISRKEDEHSLRYAIRSCIDYVDEIVLVDTGTTPIARSADDLYTDEAMEMEREEQDKVNIIPFEWNEDFAAARNFSFSQATGDVIFWIDSDDTVAHPENLRKLAQLIHDGEADWIYSRYDYHKDEWGQVDATHWKPRLFKAGTVKWEKTVHEDAVPTTGVVQVKDIDTGTGGIVVEHHYTDEHGKESELRNLGIMLAEYERDGENTDPRTLQYLGFCLEGMAEYGKAICFYQLHVQKSGSQSDRFWSLQRLSNCLYRVGDARNAVSVCMDALKLFPEWKTAYFRLAEIYYMQGEWKKVIEWTLTGMEKETPDILDVINPLDYGVLPMGRLAEAYLHENNVKLAYELTLDMLKLSPDMPVVKEMHAAAKEALELENYVRAFINVAGQIKKRDRVKAAQLFDLIPKELDADVRIQEARKMIVPPKKWPEKSVVIYCGDSLEDWAYPSVFSGIGGSETAVIRLSEQLAKKGYSVTVYNKCGDMKGEYNQDKYDDKDPKGNIDGRRDFTGITRRGSVTYVPYYFFDPRDSFDVLVGWRCPGLFMDKMKARKSLLWLHDILHEESINERIVGNVDKILFLSKWHRDNVKWIPEERVVITNNGIHPDDFKDLPPKRPKSLIWSSSPDRGLIPFMDNIWPLIQKEVPDVTIDICYGMQNIEKEMGTVPHLREVYDRCQEIFKMPGVTYHGRISHLKLAKLMGSTMVMPYASEFGETNMISSQEAQVAGCYVVMSSQAGGAPEYVKFGEIVEGDGIYTDGTLQKIFARRVANYIKPSPNDNLTYQKRPDVSKDFSWETTVKHWIKEIL